MSAPCLPVRHPKKRKRTANDGAETNGDVKVEDSPPNFEDVESMDAAEYLARVVKQAKTMPDVFVAGSESLPDGGDGSGTSNSIPSRFRDHVPIEGSAASLSYLISARASLTAPPSQEHLPKDEQWIQNTIANFEKVREYLENCRSKGIGGKKTNRIPLPSMRDRSGWHIFCVGKDEARGNTNAYFDNGSDGESEAIKAEQQIPEWQQGVPSQGFAPNVRLLAQMDQVLVRRVLSHIGYYATQGWSVTPQRSAWVYSLLARLEKPVHRDDAAILFSLLKRLTLCRSKVDVNGKREELARLNVLIALIGIYFEQGAHSAMTFVSSSTGSDEGGSER